ncbi:unnamed protein product [Macrosiphum euphorbiae]|uniref:CCHC-type domain-containing protein n=1 Tax=Macrosiphum euphorbiae TaxID=13131 RepID=A0AAV0WLP5_9HEMI|nr:unnamed protein product [Macrosiphum euphorbiae]
MDHYMSQLMSGYGNLNKSLLQFKLRGDAIFRCGVPEHLLRDCPLFDHEREEINLRVQAASENWPCDNET